MLGAWPDEIMLLGRDLGGSYVIGGVVWEENVLLGSGLGEVILGA